MIRRPPRSTLFPYTDALPISLVHRAHHGLGAERLGPRALLVEHAEQARALGAVGPHPAELHAHARDGKPARPHRVLDPGGRAAGLAGAVPVEAPQLDGVPAGGPGRGHRLRQRRRVERPGVERQARRRGAHAAPSALAAFATSRCPTQRMAPNVPPVAQTASIAVTLIFACASRVISSSTAPGRSDPLTRNAFLGPTSFHFAALAAARKVAASSGTKSICARRPLGKPENASRLTRASRSVDSMAAPTPGVFGVST